MKGETLIVYFLATLLTIVKGQNVSTSFSIETSTLQPKPLRLVPVSSTTMRASFTLNSTPPELISSLSSSVLPSGSPVSAPASVVLTSDSVSTEPILSVLPSTLAQDTVSMATYPDYSANISQVETLDSSLIASTSVGVMTTTTFYPESSSTDSAQNTSKASAILSDIAVPESTSALERNTTVLSLTSTIFVSSVSSTILPALNDTAHEMSANTTSLSYVTEINTTETSTISNSLVSPTSSVQISNLSSIELHDSFKDSSDVLSTYPSETIAIFATSATNPISGTPENYSILGTAETSVRTDHFTESVYRLANISSSSVLLIPSQPSTVAFFSVSESNSYFTSSDDRITSILPTLSSEILFSTWELTGPNASVTLNVTEVVTKPSLMQTLTLSYKENTTSNIDHLYTSEYDISPSSQSSEQHLTTSFSPSSSIGTVHITQSSSSDVTQTLESLVHTSSATIHPLGTSETYSSVTTSSVTSPSSASTMPVQTVIMNTTTTTSTSTAASTTSTPLSTETTNLVSTNKDVTTSIPTTTGNFTLQVTVKKHKIYRVMFTFVGNCEILGENELLQVEFWKAFMYILQSTTKLHLYNLNAEQMLCDPLLRIYLRIGMLNESASVNISQIFEFLKCRIASSELFVPIIEGMHVLNYTATKFEVVEIISSDMNELEVAKTGLELVDVVIISIASFLFAVLVFMMIIVLCRECYVRKRTTTFHLSDVPHVNLKLSDFTLTRIPRPKMFYRENSLRKPGPIPVSKLRSAQNGHSDANGNDRVKVNPDHIRVRMSKHEDGLVVGVTCSNPPSPKNDSSSCSSSPINGDQAKTSLLKEDKKENSDGVTNQSYSTDEEHNTKIVIDEDENEQLL